MADVLHKVANHPEYLTFWCPGCQCGHFAVISGDKEPIWQWNGSMDKPTFNPSILRTGAVPITDEQAQRILSGEKINPIPLICHLFVKDGYIEFLKDSTHELSGKIFEMKWPCND